MSKLTLSIEKETIDVAKQYAARHGTSVSQLVQHFLSNLQKDDEEEFFAQLHAELKRACYRAPAGDLDTLRNRHVERKYR